MSVQVNPSNSIDFQTYIRSFEQQSTQLEQDQFVQIFNHFSAANLQTDTLTLGDTVISFQDLQPENVKAFSKIAKRFFERQSLPETKAREIAIKLNNAAVNLTRSEAFTRAPQLLNSIVKKFETIEFNLILNQTIETQVPAGSSDLITTLYKCVNHNLLDLKDYKTHKFLLTALTLSAVGAAVLTAGSAIVLSSLLFSTLLGGASIVLTLLAIVGFCCNTSSMRKSTRDVVINKARELENIKDVLCKPNFIQFAAKASEALEIFEPYTRKLPLCTPAFDRRMFNQERTKCLNDFIQLFDRQAEYAHAPASDQTLSLHQDINDLRTRFNLEPLSHHDIIAEHTVPAPNHYTVSAEDPAIG